MENNVNVQNGQFYKTLREEQGSTGGPTGKGAGARRGQASSRSASVDVTLASTAVAVAGGSSATARPVSSSQAPELERSKSAVLRDRIADAQ